MKHILKSVFTLMLALFILVGIDAQILDRSIVPQPGPAGKIELGKTKTFELENGLKVIVVENHKLPRVSVSLSLDIDLNREKDKAGVREVYGTVMKGGTVNRTKEQLDKEIDFVGATLLTGSSYMYGTSLKKHLNTLMGLYTDVLYNPSFPQEELDKIVKTVKSSLKNAKSDAASIANNISYALNYGKDHPYGEIITEETIDNIKVEDLKKHYDNYWKPNVSYLIIVGDIKFGEAKKLATKHFGSWKKGLVPTHTYEVSPLPKANGVYFGDKTGAVQSQINITYPIDLKPFSPDRIKVKILNFILGDSGFSGRLMQNIREDKGYTYGAYSKMSNDDVVGEFSASAQVRNEVTDSAVVEFLYEIKRLATEEISEDELKLAKAALKGRYGRSLENPQTVANFAYNIQKYGLPADYFETYLQKIDAITIADIKTAAGKYLKPENLNIVVVGSKDEVAEKLKQFDADGEITFYDYEGNEVTEFLEPAPAGVTVESILTTNALKQSVSTTLEEAAAKLKGIDKMYTKYSLSVQGMSLTNETILSGDKFANVIKMGPTLFQKQTVVGEVGKSTGMQGDKDMSAEEVKSLKDKISQQKNLLNFKEKLDKYTLEGVTEYKGKKVYKLTFEDKEEKTKAVKYYSVETSLSVASITTIEQEGQKISIISEIDSYKEVDGLMIPEVMTQNAGQVLEMKLLEASINKDVDESIFE